ncbi:MAG: tetratricopeptide repeat protein [Magnetococcales bacterium]|nr:tetratricopeptide repeat protein [Magnetococcales bacterium]
MKRIRMLFLPVLAGMLLTACAGEKRPDDGEGDSFRIAMSKGKAYLERGVPVMALPALRRARELQPDHPDVLLMLGMAYDQANRPVQALEVLEHAQRLQPENGRINNNLGVALMRMERWGEAVAAFETAARDVNFPTPEEIHFNLALVRKQQGRQREMLAALETALKVSPAYAPALLELAIHHRLMGRPDLEQADLRRLLAENPGHGAALEMLIDSLLKAGKSAEAREYLRGARDAQPGGETARWATEKLAILEKVP